MKSRRHWRDRRYRFDELKRTRQSADRPERKVPVEENHQPHVPRARHAGPRLHARSLRTVHDLPVLLLPLRRGSAARACRCRGGELQPDGAEPREDEGGEQPVRECACRLLPLRQRLSQRRGAFPSGPRHYAERHRRACACGGWHPDHPDPGQHRRDHRRCDRRAASPGYHPLARGLRVRELRDGPDRCDRRGQG